MSESSIPGHATRLPDLVVLDLDGTVCVLDVPWEDVKRQLVAIAGRHGLPTAGHRRVLGLLETARQLGPPAVLAEMAAVVEAAEVEGARCCLPNDELLAWVQDLPPSSGVSVLSLNAPIAVRLALGRAGIADRVRWVLGRGDVRPKPHPEGLDVLLRRHDVSPGSALFVGDSGADRECARRASVPYLDVRRISEPLSGWLAA